MLRSKLETECLGSANGLECRVKISPLDFGKILAKERWALGRLICKYLYLLDSFSVFNRLIVVYVKCLQLHIIDQ